MDLILRPKNAAEAALNWVVDSPFDDFGPRSADGDISCDLDGSGSMVVDVDGRAAGSVSWHWRHWGPNAGSRSVMIGIGLQSAYCGQGIGTRAQRQLVDLLFTHTTTNRVEAHTDVENIAEQRALEACGFTKEGVIRGAQWRAGEYRDGFLYSMLRDDWNANSRQR